MSLRLRFAIHVFKALDGVLEEDDSGLTRIHLVIDGGVIDGGVDMNSSNVDDRESLREWLSLAPAGVEPNDAMMLLSSAGKGWGRIDELLALLEKEEGGKDSSPL